jgi:hypothetical protein
MKKILILLFVLCSVRGFSQVVALTGKTQAAGVNYTHTTASSGDWGSVANDTYFYDLTDELAHYKDGSGTVLEVFAAGGGGNIYTANGSLTGDRVLETGSNELQFLNTESAGSYREGLYLKGTLSHLRLSTIYSGGTNSFALTNASIDGLTQAYSGIEYNHNGRFTVYNQSASGYGIRLNANINQTSIVGINTYRNSFGFGWALHNFDTGVDVINLGYSNNYVGIGIDTEVDASILARLHVKGSGNTSGTTALLVENSSGTDLWKLKDNGLVTMTVPTGATNEVAIAIAKDGGYGTSSIIQWYGTGYGIGFGVSTGPTTAYRLGINNNGYVTIGGTAYNYGFTVANGDAGFLNNVYIEKNLGIGNTQPQNISGDNVISILNGTAPTSNIANSCAMYSADQTAGNASPHFRTENGDVIRIFANDNTITPATLSGGGGTTITDTDTFGGFTLQEIAAALIANGLLK